MTAPTPGWRDKAACLDADPDLFMLPEVAQSLYAHAATAKAFCDRCTVVADCLDDAREKRAWGVYRAGMELRSPIKLRCRRAGCTNRAVANPGRPPAFCSPNCRAAMRASERKPTPRTHCRRNHEFTPQNTRRDSRGVRICNTCKPPSSRGVAA